MNTRKRSGNLTDSCLEESPNSVSTSAIALSEVKKLKSEEDDNLCHSDWDFYHVLRARELSPPFKINGRSDQLDLRKGLIEWTLKQTKAIGVESSVVHLSVRIIDFFMEKHRIEESLLKSVAMTALLVASKSHEDKQKAPRLSSVLKMLNKEQKQTKTSRTIRKFDILCIEKMILKCLRWQLLLPTFWEAGEVIIPCAMNGFEQEQVKSFRNLWERFSEKALLDKSLIGARPSLIAVSVIRSVRLFLGLSDKICTWDHYSVSEKTLINDITYRICGKSTTSNFHGSVLRLLSVEITPQHFPNESRESLDEGFEDDCS